MSTPCDILKRREILFHPLPPGQIPQAAELLSRLAGVKVDSSGECSLLIEYCITEHCLEDIESLLTAHGLHLEGSLLIRIRQRRSLFDC